MNVRSAVLTGVSVLCFILLQSSAVFLAELGSSSSEGLVLLDRVSMAPPIVGDPLPVDLAPPPVSAKAVASLQAEAEALVLLINEARRTHPDLGGVVLPALKSNASLTTAAENHSTSMALNDFVGHCDTFSGTLPGDRLTTLGYEYDDAAESIVVAFSNAQTAYDALINSPSSRALMLSHQFREIGVGFVDQDDDVGTVDQDLDGDCTEDIFNKGPYRYYVTINYGLRSTETLLTIDRESPSTSASTVQLHIYAENGWAAQMQFSNDAISWSAWESFSTDTAWYLTTIAPETKTVWVGVRNAAQTETRVASDTIDRLACIFEDNFETGDWSRWSDMVIELAASSPVPYTDQERLSK